MAATKIALIKIEKFHDESVESFRCGSCSEEFSFAAVVVLEFCPLCGVEFQTDEDETT